MKLILLRILFIFLIPFGAFVLYIAIRLLRKSLAGKVLTEIPFLQKSTSFTIEEQGVYAVWQKGEMFKKLPVDKFRPVITNSSTQEKIKLHPSIFRANSNNGKTFRMKMFGFTAQPGNYTLDLAEGSSISELERMVSLLFPAKKIDLNNYFIQIRESQPFYFLIIGIVLAAISGFMMIGGLVFAILADQIFA